MGGIKLRDRSPASSNRSFRAAEPSYASSASTTSTTPSTEQSSTDAGNDPFAVAIALLPPRPPSLSSSDESLPVPSSASSSQGYASSSASSPSRSSTASSIARGGGTRAQLFPVSSRHDQDRRIRISEEIAKVERKIQMCETQQQLLRGTVHVARVFGDLGLAERITRLLRKVMVREVLLRRAKTMLGREARTELAGRTGPSTAGADQDLVIRSGRSAPEGRGEEADLGRERADRTSEWLKGVSRTVRKPH